MKIRTEVDIAMLEKSIKKAAKKIGENGKTATARWGVATAREIALSTQPFGNGGTAKKQRNAIEKGMLAVCRPVTKREVDAARRRGRVKVLSSASEISRWVDEHRTGGKGHARLNGGRRALCTKAHFNKARRARNERAGKAKGAWIGAGQHIAKRQRGPRQLKIGKGFLGWTQRHTSEGDSVLKGTRFKPFAELINKARHTRSSYVVKKGDMRKAVLWGGRKTLKWYEITARKELNK